MSMNQLRSDTADQLTKIAYSRREVAAMLAINPLTVFRMLHDGRLRGIRVGRCWRILRADLERFLQINTGATKDEVEPE